jgi:ABC-type transporter Mla subunit MlaD
MKQTSEGAQDMGKKMSSILPSFKTVALTATAAFGAVSAAVYKSVQAAGEDQKSMMLLADQLKKTTGATDAQVASVERFITQTMMATGVADDQLRPAFAALTRATGSLAVAQDQMGLAMDISAGTGKDLSSVSLALGKAFTGNVAALVKLGIPLDETTKKTKDLEKIQAKLKEQFGGAAATAANTFSGRLQILRVSMGEIVESVGYLLMPYFEKMIDFIQTKIVPGLAAFTGALQDGKGLRGGLLAAANAMGSFGLKALDVIETVAVGFLELLRSISKFGSAIAVLSAVGNAMYGNIPAAAASIAAFTGLYYAYDRLDGVIATTQNAFDGFRSDLNRMPQSAGNGGAGLDKLNIKLIETGAVATASQQQLRETLNLIDRFNSKGPAKTFIGPLLPSAVKAIYNETNAGIESAQKLAEQYKDLFSNIGGGAKGTGDKLDTLAKKTDAYEKVLTDLNTTANRTRDAFGTVEDAAKTLTKASNKVSEAQTKFNLVTGGYGKSSKEYIAALRDVERANKSVRDATIQQKDALVAVRDAEKKLADLRAKAANPEDVASAERSLERSKFDVEQSNFAVIDAETELAKLRQDPLANPIEIRRAEIGLAEAKLDVTEATLGQRDAETTLSDARNMAATPDEIAAAERELEDAKRDQTDATDDLAESIYEQSVLQAVLTEVTYGAAEGSETYKQALLDLQEAQDAEAEAAQRHTDALERQKDAVIDLKNAIASLNEIQGKVNQKAITKAEGKVGKNTTDVLNAANKFINANIAATMPNLDSFNDHMAMRGGFYPFADGGIVTKPTLGLVGEAGAEAIIPLDKLGAMGGNTYITVNAGMGVDGGELGQQIIDAIKKAERRSGKVFASA